MEPRIIAEHIVYRAVPKTPQAVSHWFEAGYRTHGNMSDYPMWSADRFPIEKIRELASEHYPGYALEKQRSVTYEWEIVE